MKKLLSILLTLTLLSSLAIPALAAEDTYELALVTDVGTIDDKSFNQGAWEGLVAYAEEHNISHKYYQPAEQSDEAYLDSIALAVEGGAKVIVTPGFLFEAPIYLAQDMYPDVHFILIDGEPHSADGSEYRTNANTAAILYAEQEAGYLAGYAAVKEGFTKLGFVGGIAVPAVIRYGYGYVKGADDAAVELGLDDVTINYYYCGGFGPTPEVQTQAASWYNDGTEVIFACAGGAGNSVMAAAEAADKWMIGVDVDQSSESAKVITSSTKGLKASVYQTIEAYYAGTFPGGVTTVMKAANDGVALPMESSHFEHFAQADYDQLYAKLAAGEIALPDDKTAATADQLETKIVKVNYLG